MADPYANIRRALEMGPTPGALTYGEDNDGWYVEAAGNQIGYCLSEPDAAHIAACDPDTIRALLAERDADLKRLAFLSKEPVVEGFVGITKDVYDYACDCAEEGGRDEPDDEDMLNGMRRLIDAAIAAANGGGNG